MVVPDEVPVGELGVLGGVRLDRGQRARHLPAGVGRQLADNLAHQESIVEVGGSGRRQGHVALLVLLP
jgi:hypothetical protein